MNTSNLKAARKKSGKTQKEVAEGIGIGQGTYKNYETGAREPNGDTLVAIANYFGVSTDYLLGRPDAQPPTDALERLFTEKPFSALEEELLRKYMELPHEARQAVVQFINDATITARRRQAGVHGNTYVLRAASRSNHDQPVTNVTLTADELADLQNSPDVDPDL